MGSRGFRFVFGCCSRIVFYGPLYGVGVSEYRPKRRFAKLGIHAVKLISGLPSRSKSSSDILVLIPAGFQCFGFVQNIGFASWGWFW